MIFLTFVCTFCNHIPGRDHLNGMKIKIKLTSLNMVLGLKRLFKYLTILFIASSTQGMITAKQRMIFIGKIQNITVVVVVHTDRNGRTRVISARPASKKERMIYNEKTS
jgi:uncharacterized DUF497 family protein